VLLVGLPGAGVTTVGTLLAQRLGRPLLDSDAIVEQRTGHTVRELWEAHGEAGYRDLETAALRDVLGAPAPFEATLAGPPAPALPLLRPARAAHPR
jgi:shikimate kinase